MWEDRVPHWFDSISFGEIVKTDGNFESNKREAESTGYTYEEIAKIENAFEWGWDDKFGQETDDDGYLGLMAVVDVLADIHGIDLTTREETKKLFIKQPQL